MLRLVCAMSAIALLPALARADDRGDFVTLDRAGATDVVGLSIAGHFYDDETHFSLRENLYGRYVDRSGFGAFGQIAVAQSFGDGGTTAISAAEIGGLYVASLGKADLAVHLGIGLPTGSTTLEGRLTNLVASVDRIQDVALALPHTLYLRPGAALKLGDRSFFGQVDVGADIAFKTEDDGSSQSLVHANAGIGTVQGPVALTAEFSNYFVDNNGVHVVHELAATARLVGGALVPYASYGFIFSDGDQHAHVLIAGLEQAF